MSIAWRRVRRVARPLLLAAGMFLILSFLARQSIFYPSRHPEGFWDLQAGLEAADVFMTAADGVRIHGWLIPSQESGGPLTSVFLHGNAGNITHRGAAIREITAAGSELLIVDYRGYGKSEGSPSEEGIYLDAEAAYDWLVEQGRSPSRIIVHGESLGTAAAVDLASRKRAGGVILEAPFPSARAVAARVMPVIGPLLVSGFETARKIPEIRCPLLVIHGKRDEVIAYTLGRQVFDAAREPKEFWTVDEAGHNDLLHVAGAQYRERLRAFYNRVRKAGQ